MKRYINKIAQDGFGGSIDVAEFYDKSRPNYSIETINKVSDIINDNNQSNGKPIHIVEVATGTGKFTKSFMKDERVSSNHGNHYTVSEPIDTFIGQLNIENLQSPKWKIDKYITSSDKLTMIKDNSIDAVIAAQSFHWMDSINTLKEFHRVLKPKAPIIFVWNSFDVNVDYIKAIEDVVDEQYKIMENKTGEIIPRYRTMRWEKIFNTNDAKQFFKPLQKWCGYQNYNFNQEQIMNHVRSISIISSLSEIKKKEVLEKVKHVLDHHKDTRNKQNLNFQYNVDIAYAVKSN